jgi:hypothetical protein
MKAFQKVTSGAFKKAAAEEMKKMSKGWYIFINNISKPVSTFADRLFYLGNKGIVFSF